MNVLTRLVLARRWWVIGAWLALAVLGGIAAPRAVHNLSYEFGLPGQPGYEANVEILRATGSGGQDAPVLLVLGGAGTPVPADGGAAVAAAVRSVVPGARVASPADRPALRSPDGTVDVVLLYPRPTPGAAEPYASALPRLREVAAAQQRALGVPVRVTGVDALASDDGGGSPNVLVETLVGGIGALVVLVAVFGSFLALTPVVVAAASILTTFAILWGLTSVTQVSFVVQYLLALIGLGVAIDYALLVVTRWREERAAGGDPDLALHRTMATAGRSVLFSGVTVAVSLAALMALPVPFLRSIGYTGLLIPLLSVAAALTLLPALLSVAGARLAWPNRRSGAPDSRLWRAIGRAVVRRRWLAAAISTLALVALAIPLFGVRLGSPANDSLSASGGSAGAAVRTVERSGLGAGLTKPVEVLTDDPARTLAAVRDLPGVAGAVDPGWQAGAGHVVDVWTAADPSTGAGREALQRIRGALQADRVGGVAVQDVDFVSAVYGNAWWVALLIGIATFALLVCALRSIVLPLKALLLNVLSLGAAYGVTVLIWQRGFGTQALFGQQAAGAVTVWVPVAVFAFLFGLSMDYEVFLLSRIREAHEDGQDTDTATVTGVSRTGRLVTSGALILFLAFVSLSQVPSTDVKVLATGLALGILLDATVVRGVLAPALVAALGPANWWRPSWPGRRR